jgi:uncharacterized protein YjiS (DUF1127 family)
MTQLTIHFVDPSIPGISGRDLVGRAAEAMQAAYVEAGGAYRESRREYAIRKALARLDMRQLRDLGIDRDAA